MRKIAAVESISLDGVMQAPGRPDEDERGGFAHGGRAAPYAADPVQGRVMAGHDARTRTSTGRGPGAPTTRSRRAWTQAASTSSPAP